MINNFTDETSFIRPAMRAIRFTLLAVLGCLIISSLSPVRAQELRDQRKRGLEMLNAIKHDIKEHYFDPKFRGIDLDAHFTKASEQIQQAVSGDQIFGIIASALLAFNDSHTFFIPPVLSVRVEYGWEMQMIGDKCYVVSVKPGSDAASKGLKRGDRILSVFDIAPTRDNLWQLEYLFYRLRPLNAMRVVAQSPGGKPVPLELLTKVEKTTLKNIEEMDREASLSREYYYDAPDKELFIWKMSDFTVNEKGIDGMMKLVGQHKALILDLRGNSGGYEIILLRLLGYFFDHDIIMAEVRGRKESKPVIAKSRGSKVFNGQLVVLVDSRSASAAELFARTIQLAKRGTVIGDHTAGAVTEAGHFIHTYQWHTELLKITYGASVTINDLIMPDGKSLERLGVTPDKLLLPDVTDLASGRDSVLIQSAEFLGIKFDPEKAGPPRQLKSEN